MWKRIVLLGLAVCLAVPLSALAGGRKPIVAVFEIQPRGVNLNRDLLRSLTEYLGTALSESGAYRVVPPGDIRRALMGKARESYKECYDKQCQIELGRELAANKTISSSILKIGKSCVVTCSVYDLKTQTAELSAKVEGRCGADALLASLREVARKVCAKKTGQGSEASKLDEILKRTTTKVAEREWQNPPAENAMPWQDAIDYCENLSLDGHDDWRLPSISELRSLIRGCAATETGGSCRVDDGCLSYDTCWDDPCSGCDNGGGPAGGCYWPDEMEGPCSWYWSSSPREDSGGLAWVVAFGLASVFNDFVSYDRLVRCVRLGG